MSERPRRRGLTSRESQSVALGGNSPHSSPKSRALVLWRKRSVRPSDRHALHFAKRYAAQRAEDLGGRDILSAAELAMVDAEALLLGMVRLILAAPDHELVGKDADGRKSLSPAAREIPKLLGQASRIAEALGLKRRPRRAETLADLRRQYEAGEADHSTPIPVEHRVLDAEPA